MKNYDEFIFEAEMAFSDIDFSKIKPYEDETNLEYLSLREMGKQGKLAQYIDEGHQLKFGMLKALFRDALEYKKKREYEKGVAKFAVRIIPIAIAPIFFPIWMFSQILGATRALNKIIIPTLMMSTDDNYGSFLTNMITKTMNLIEGDIKPFLGNDWYYDMFGVHDGLIKMVRQEHIYKFAVFISEKIQKKKDDDIVPHYWLDSEFRKWLNEKFQLDLPVGKVMIRHKEKV